MSYKTTIPVPPIFDQIGEHLRHESRFSLPEKLQHTVKLFCEHQFAHATILKQGKEFWRARVNHHGITEAFGVSQVGAPPKGMAGSGRINPAGISYLYGASDKETALSEVRPWKGAIVTVANFTLKREVKVADFVQDIPTPNVAEVGLNEFSDHLMRSLISQILQGKYFSAPAHAHDDYAYLASQYIAEQLKNMGLDGIKYPSVLSETGENICLFDPTIGEFEKTATVTVKKVSYDFE
ncbi:RES family NAD+ phosphorylase [Aliivibrio wodanis]|uniref:RES family NAD+ phosphorylase n=1 Tax=Aliivibrio wodanis TaxID=80852 RepID=UPI00406C5E9F